MDTTLGTNVKRSYPPYIWRGLLDLLLVLPVLFQASLLLTALVASMLYLHSVAVIILLSIAGLAFLFTCFFMGQRLIKKSPWGNEQDRRLHSATYLSY